MDRERTENGQTTSGIYSTKKTSEVFFMPHTPIYDSILPFTFTLLKRFSGWRDKFNISLTFPQATGDLLNCTGKRRLKSHLSHPSANTTFVSLSPVPFTKLSMLVMGIILGIAAGTYFGPYGDFARNGIEALNGLFCKMMDVVYNVIPFFLFFALIRGWMNYGFIYYFSLVKNITILLPGFVLLAILYMVELGISGINPLTFIKDYRMILLENLKIGSNIQAMPYNKRTMSRMTSLPREILEEGLKLGGMMNMDGNCVIVSMGIMGMISSTGIELSVAKWIMLAFIVILLSVGAPNQPGSFLLSLAVLMSFVGISSNLTGDLLIIEALLGKLYSCANATGDIVTLAIENARYERKNKEKEKSE